MVSFFLLLNLLLKTVLVQRSDLPMGAVGNKSREQHPGGCAHRAVFCAAIGWVGLDRELENGCNNIIFGALHFDHMTSNPNTTRKPPFPPQTPHHEPLPCMHTLL